MFNTTKKPTVESVAKSWKTQYIFASGSWHKVHLNNHPHGIDAGVIHDQLLKATTLEECEKIIGNDSWTTSHCSECGKTSNQTMIIVGDEYALNICETCVDNMKMTLIKAQGLD